MTMLKTIAVASLTLIGAAPARACIAPGLETYVLLDSAPASLPKGALAMKVRVSGRAAEIAEAGRLPVEAEVRATASVQGAGHIYIDPGPWSSCSRWGRLNADAYVVGFVTRRADGKVVLRAVQSEPFQDIDRYRIDPALRAKTP